MSDLIDRGQAIAIIDELNVVSFYEANEHSREAYKDIRIAIEQLLSAEKTGRWLDIGKFTDIDGNHHEVWKCEWCGYISYDDSNFCPNCGAKMED